MLGGLIGACRKRITSLETFYAANDLHERASEVERTRLRLKRAVRDAEVALEQHHAHTTTPPAPRTSTTQLRVRLTPEEFEDLQQRRTAHRQSQAHLTKGEGKLMWEHTAARPGHTVSRLHGVAGLISEGPWSDPARFSHREDTDAAKWITKDGFDSTGKHPQRLQPRASEVTGPSAGPYTTSRAEVVLVRPNETPYSVDKNNRFTPIVTTGSRT